MCVILLFVIVLILFVYDGDQYWNAAEWSGVELLLTIVNRFQSLSFVIGRFVLNVLAVPDPPLLSYFFSVNSIMVCSEVSFG